MLTDLGRTCAEDVASPGDDNDILLDVMAVTQPFELPVKFRVLAPLEDLRSA